MRSNPTNHKKRIQAEFAKQSEAFAAQSWIKDDDRIAALINVVQPTTSDRVLDVATGPGYIAMGFAAVCREVVGLDLTERILEVAQRTAGERGITNLSFRLGDAEDMPFGNSEFHLSVCRFVLYHSESPQKLVSEMARVVVPGGRVVVQDLFASENAERAAFHNTFEILRDPSHTRALPLSELITIVASVGLEIETVQTSVIEFDVEQWLTTTQTPSDAAETVQSMLDQDRLNDLSSTRPVVLDGRLILRERMAIVIGRKTGIPQ